ncbi:MAG: TetR/AcrR family transcriptional regulator [Spirochaetaceae bacterium]|nr:TetR/AcrR family transcriptional regulator [Myxococcales bacterium]MCB9725112.1 TetR/AcrR family transcriptional regulator [Spirochaetaceae bacterium]HPG25690.1 helix-turn-helix domain-containing protein [Myxococcota bacterium]
MPKQVDPEAQKAEIRNAARRVFARQGIASTGLEHVARDAGMGRSSLYHYYPDKQTLLRELVAETLDAERAIFRHHLEAEGRALDRIDGLIDACVGLFDAWASLGRFLLDLRQIETTRFRRFFRETRRDLARVIEQGQADGELDRALDAPMVASVLIGAIDGLLVQHYFDRRALDPDRARATLRQIARRTLAS